MSDEIRFISVIPAYGRDYKTEAEVQAAWDAGSDFLIEDYALSGYVNIGDKPDNFTLQVRYAKQSKIHIIK